MAPSYDPQPRLSKVIPPAPEGPRHGGEGGERA